MNKTNRINRMNRKGMWMQVFLISFFVILIIFCIILLSIDVSRGTLESKRTYVDQDLLDQKATASLIGLLRMPIAVNDKTIRLADAISMNDDGKYSDIIINNLKTNLKITGTCSFSSISSQTLKLEPLWSINKPHGILYTTKTLLPGSNGNIEISLVCYNTTTDEWAGEYNIFKSTSIQTPITPSATTTPDATNPQGSCIIKQQISGNVMGTQGVCGLENKPGCYKFDYKTESGLGTTTVTGCSSGYCCPTQK